VSQHLPAGDSAGLCRMTPSRTSAASRPCLEWPHSPRRVIIITRQSEAAKQAACITVLRNMDADDCLMRAGACAAAAARCWSRAAGCAQVQICSSWPQHGSLGSLRAASAAEAIRQGITAATLRAPFCANLTEAGIHSCSANLLQQQQLLSARSAPRCWRQEPGGDVDRLTLSVIQ
jgi:hypothetical protein